MSHGELCGRVWLEQRVAVEAERAEAEDVFQADQLMRRKTAWEYAERRTKLRAGYTASQVPPPRPHTWKPIWRWSATFKCTCCGTSVRTGGPGEPGPFWGGECRPTFPGIAPL